MFISRSGFKIWGHVIGDRKHSEWARGLWIVYSWSGSMVIEGQGLQHFHIQALKHPHKLESDCKKKLADKRFFCSIYIVLCPYVYCYISLAIRPCNVDYFIFLSGLWKRKVYFLSVTISMLHFSANLNMDAMWSLFWVNHTIETLMLLSTVLFTHFFNSLVVHDFKKGQLRELPLYYYGCTNNPIQKEFAKTPTDRGISATNFVIFNCTCIPYQRISLKKKRKKERS